MVRILNPAWLILVLCFCACQSAPVQVAQVSSTDAPAEAATEAPTATTAPTATATALPTSTPAASSTPARFAAPTAGGELLAQSGQAVNASKTLHMKMVMTVELGGQSIDITMDALTENPEKAYIEVTSAGATIEVVTLDQERVYTRMPGSEVWIEAGLADMAPNYESQLAPAEIAKHPVTTGEETVDGVDTYVVSYEIDIGKLVQTMPQLAQLVDPLESSGEGTTWIGKDDLLPRKFEMKTTMSVADQEFTYRYEGTIGEYNEPVRIPQPEPFYRQHVLQTSDLVLQLAFSPDGKTLAASDQDQFIYLWPTADLAAEPRLIENPALKDIKKGGMIVGLDYYALVFSPDGESLAAGTDGLIHVYSLNDLTAEPVKLEVGDTTIDVLAYSPDGKYLVGGGSGGKIYLWTADDLDAKPVVLSGHESSVVDMAFTRDGKSLISGCEDGQVLLWTMNDLDASPAAFTGHKTDFHALDVTPDGQYLISVGFNDPVYAWALAKPGSRPDLLIPRSDDQTGKLPTLDIAISPDGQTLATADTGGSVRLWPLPSAEEPFGVISTGSQYDLMSLEYAPDGKYLAAGSGASGVYVWELSPEP